MHVENILQMWSSKGWQLKEKKQEILQKGSITELDEVEVNSEKRKSDIQVADTIIQEGN